MHQHAPRYGALPIENRGIMRLMRRSDSAAVRAVLTSCSVLFLFGCAFAHGKHSAAFARPNRIEIGRFSFSDSGPPFHAYELFIVSPAPEGSSIQRISMTEPGSICLAPSKYEIVSGKISKTPVELFGKTNPCKVPDKVLLESDHCIACPVYSAGTEISLQVPCGSQARMIRRFFPNGSAESNPPRHDSWMVEVMRELEYAAGSVGRPFPIVDAEEPQPSSSESRILEEIGAGKYDLLFQGSRDKLSNVYLASQNSQQVPTVQMRMEPIQPERFVLPVYPYVARRARIEGTVSFNFVVDGNLGPSSIVFETGNPLLQIGVSETLSRWRFPGGSIGQKIQGALEFRLNCPFIPSRVIP